MYVRDTFVTKKYVHIKESLLGWEKGGGDGKAHVLFTTVHFKMPCVSLIQRAYKQAELQVAVGIFSSTFVDVSHFHLKCCCYFFPHVTCWNLSWHGPINGISILSGSIWWKTYRLASRKYSLKWVSVLNRCVKCRLDCSVSQTSHQNHACKFTRKNLKLVSQEAKILPCVQYCSGGHY